MVWPSNGKEKIRENDQVDENKKRATPRHNMRKWNVHFIWMIINDFFMNISESKPI